MKHAPLTAIDKEVAVSRALPGEESENGSWTCDTNVSFCSIQCNHVSIPICYSLEKKKGLRQVMYVHGSQNHSWTFLVSYFWLCNSKQACMEHSRCSYPVFNRVSGGLQTAFHRLWLLSQSWVVLRKWELLQTTQTWPNMVYVNLTVSLQSTFPTNL